LLFRGQWLENQTESLFFTRFPGELRNKVYGYALAVPTPPSHPDPDEGEPVPLFSDFAAPRFTCRQMDQEARKIVFRDNIHVLNWLHHRRSFARPGDYLNRMYNLEQDLVSEMRRIAIYTAPKDVDELLFELRIHMGEKWSPVRRLEELRIILDIPYHTNNDKRTTRIRQEREACHTAHHLANVDRVIIQNLFHRPENDFRDDTREEWGWNILKWEEDDVRLNDDR